jgi:hypothetical protein
MAQYGSALVCVRYRNDPLARKRYKTVELIVAEQPWEPSASPSSTSGAGRMYRERSEVLVGTSYTEHDLRARIKQVGGRWLPDLKLWSMSRRYAIATGLQGRIVRVAK